MLGFDEYHYDLISKYEKLFGSLFTGLEVYRENNQGSPSRQKVPLTHSEKDKVLAFAQEKFGDDEMAVATISPRMGFSRTGSIQYDSSRKTNKYQRIKLEDGYTRSFVPYNLFFELVIVGKTETDCQRIVEQIAPFFDPSMSVTVYPLKGDHSYSRDITITLNQITNTDTYEGEEETRRTVIWTLEFTMQAFLFGPIVNTAGGPIKKIILTYNDAERTNIFPGLTSNGQPTEDPQQAIDYKQVNEDDPFAVITLNERL